MTINFNKIVESKTVIVPIVQGTFQYNRKKYAMILDTLDFGGWWKVKILGDIVEVLEQVFPEIDLPDIKTIKGYSYNNKMVFQNFDVGKRKVGLDIMGRLYFNNAPTFSSIKAVLWEDGCLYYYGVNYNDMFLPEVKQAFDEDIKSPKIKKMTPEIKALYLFHELERQAIQKADLEIKKTEDLKRWRESLSGRLHSAFNSVGAEVLEYSVSGNRLIVDWKLEETGRKYNSILNADTLVTIECGFCVSGADKKFNITSMVLTAKEYEKDSLTYITRRNRDDEGYYDD